jgi:Ca2+-binding RTX toxin-like protein
MRGIVACVWVIAATVAAAPAGAATVPVDALGPLGDEHVIFPTYHSQEKVAPDVTAGNIGDVNGDGVDDTGMQIESFEPSYPDSVWVTYSPTSLPATVAAGLPGWNGMHIVGAHFWSAVKGLGDVNGDGIGEVVVETVEEDIVVVFGRTDTATVDVNDLGDQGFKISHAAFGPNTGFGTGSGGVAYENTQIADAGDQNGDGRPDLAFRDFESIKVAYTPPDPAGAVVDADNLGNGGFTLETHVPYPYGFPYVDRLGDLNGDGRNDLMVAWDTPQTDHTAYAVGLVSPGPGEVVDLRTVADDGRGFELSAPNSYLENAIALGDQNGDGRKEIALADVGYDDFIRNLIVGYSPGLGAKRTVRPPAAGEGESFNVYDGNVFDVGDQDGDGKSDVAFSDVVRFSGGGSAGSTNPVGPGGALFLTLGSIIVGSVADRNDDGKRELITVIAAPYVFYPPSTATWLLDVFQSAKLPLPDEIEPPVDSGDLLEFTGTFITAPDGGTRSLAARPSVELTRPGGSTATVASDDVIDANSPTTDASVDVDPDAVGLQPGVTYGYRMLLENGRGLVGASPKRLFTYRPSDGGGDPGGGDPGGGGTGPGAGGGGPKPPARKLIRGTPRADALMGGPGADTIFGLAGADILRGGAGNDVLRGGQGDDEIRGELGNDLVVGSVGHDVLHGGAGDDVVEARDGRRDRIRCGPGRDRVKADRIDAVTGCETVARG